MITIKRGTFKPEIKSHGKTWVFDPELTSKSNIPKGRKGYAKVLVKNFRLKDRTDAYGNEYPPSIFYYRLKE